MNAQPMTQYERIAREQQRIARKHVYDLVKAAIHIAEQDGLGSLVRDLEIIARAIEETATSERRARKED